MRVIFFLLTAVSLFFGAYSKSNGIVTDHQTGLMWQDDYDSNTNTVNDSVSQNYGQNAYTQCESLNNNNFGGYNDWRLPNINELLSIIDDTRSPTIGLVFQSVVTDSTGYWSSTPFDEGTLNSYYVDFGSGTTNIDKADMSGSLRYIRCVRGEIQPYKIPPTNITLSYSSITENNNTGAVIGRFTATDPDVNDTHTYTLISNDANFSVTTDGNLTNDIAFDYETTTSQSITVRVTDSGGNTFDKSFTIYIINVNEAPTATNMVASVGPNSQNTFNTFIPTYTDPEGDNPTILKIHTLPTVGTFETNSSGSWVAITSAPFEVAMSNLGN